MFSRILSLTIKEFLALLRDPRSRTVIILPPLLQLFVFSYAATFDLNDLVFAVYDEDRSTVSRDLLARFSGSRNFKEVAVLTHDREIPPLIDGKSALLVVHIGPQFSRDLAAGRSAVVQAIVDGRNSNTAAIALNYVRTIVEDFNRDRLEATSGTNLPATLEIRAWFNPNLESRWFIVPGIIGMLSLSVTVLVTGLSVAREREQGTFDQLLATPFRPFEILLGKAIPGFVIGLAEASAIIVLAVHWFEVPLRGSFVALYTGVVLFLLATIGFGLMISSLAVTQQQGLLGSFLFMVPSTILSGFSTPIANMPAAVQAVTYLNPLRYYLIILRGVFLEGTPFELLIDQYWPMAVIAAVNLTLAAWLFRRRMY